mmetsp:Transcript_14475/g.32927  ORF Transcript_14475/g.32927 Transcript_14475/m.32927 type:complete len:225 (-) Transcript_14475:141-815(-)
MPKRTMPKTALPSPNIFTPSQACLKSSHSSISFPFSWMMRSPTSQPFFADFLFTWTIMTPISSSAASSRPRPREPSASVSSIVMVTFGFSLSILFLRLFFLFARRIRWTGVRVLISTSQRPSGSSSSSGSCSSSLSSLGSSSRTALSLRSEVSTSDCSLNIFRKGFSSALFQISRQQSTPSCHFVVELVKAKALFSSRVFSSCHLSSSWKTVSSTSRMTFAAMS